MPKEYERWVDPHSEVDPSFDLDRWKDKQRYRLLDTALMGYHASSVPRRLGSDADPQALAKDKRFSKKLKSIALGLLENQWRDSNARRTFTGIISGLSSEIPQDHLRTQGAQVDWHEWVEAYRSTVLSELTLVATQLHLRKSAKEANRYTHRLVQEIAQIMDLYHKTLQDSELEETPS